MNIKRVLFTSLLSIIFCTSNAQTEHFLGFRTGMNFAKMQGDPFPTSMKSGVLLGLSYRMKFDAAWSLHADVIYGSRGAIHDKPTTTASGFPPAYTIITDKNSFKTKFTYIDVPIVFALRMPFFSKTNISPYYNTDPPAALNVFGGINTGYLFKSSQSGTITRQTDVYNDTLVSSSSEIVLVDNELDSGFSQIDIMPTIGVGMMFNTGQGRRIYFDIRYSWSMASINDGIYTEFTSDGAAILPDIKNKNLQITFGMLFSTRKRVR